jgi:hypothetical protein
VDKIQPFAAVDKLMTEFYFMLETPSETWAHICTFPTYYTVQFIAIFAKTYVQFDVGTPPLPILGYNTYICVKKGTFIHQHYIICIILAPK